MTDGTDLRNLERMMIDPDWMVSVFEWCPLAIVLIDRAGSIRLLNTHAETLFGYRREELIGKSIHNLVPESLRERHQMHVEEYAREPRVRPMGVGLTLNGVAKGGAEFPVEINLVPIFGRFGLMVAAYIRRI